MNPNAAKLKQAASVAAKVCGFSWNELLRGGLNDFLLDGIENDDSPQEIAEKCLAALLNEDARDWNAVICAMTIQFLRIALALPKTDAELRRCSLDLRVIVDQENRDSRAIQQWLKVWY